MRNKLFIFTENLKAKSGAKIFKQSFHGVCLGKKLEKIYLNFNEAPVDLKVGYYIFKVSVVDINSHTLKGNVESYKFFSE